MITLTRAVTKERGGGGGWRGKPDCRCFKREQEEERAFGAETVVKLGLEKVGTRGKSKKGWGEVGSRENAFPFKKGRKPL